MAKKFQTLFIRGNLIEFISNFVKNIEILDIRDFQRYKDEARIQIGINPVGLVKTGGDSGYSFSESKKDPPYIEISLKTGYITFHNEFFISSDSVLAGFIAFLLTTDGFNRLKEVSKQTITKNPNEIVLPFPKPVKI